MDDDFNKHTVFSALFTSLKNISLSCRQYQKLLISVTVKFERSKKIGESGTGSFQIYEKLVILFVFLRNLGLGVIN